jgi:hypothetical protein
VNPVTVALVYAVVGIVVLPLVLSLAKTKYKFFDVVLASVTAAAASFIPTIGGPVSLVVMVAILYWRIRDDLFPQIIFAVGIARLIMVPVLIVLK